MSQTFNSKAPRNTAILVVAFVSLMVGMAYGAVPLYKAFCKTTGYNGTTQVATEVARTVGSRPVTVRFDTNVAPGLAWTFESEVQSISLVPGKTTTVFFKVKNLSDKEVLATAAYNVSPDQMGGYFDKISCFCFSEQKLGPHESAEYPVVFFLDPAMEKDEMTKSVESVTLSYTFFASKLPPKPVALK